MALASNERWESGLVVVLDSSGNVAALSVTTDSSEAQWRSGFLRDPDGRLVVSSG